LDAVNNFSKIKKEKLRFKTILKQLAASEKIQKRVRFCCGGFG
jgi:hypothetical protein